MSTPACPPQNHWCGQLVALRRNTCLAGLGSGCAGAAGWGGGGGEGGGGGGGGGVPPAARMESRFCFGISGTGAGAGARRPPRPPTSSERPAEPVKSNGFFPGDRSLRE